MSDPEESSPIVRKYLDLPDEYHSLEQRYARARARLDSLSEEGIYLGILGLNEVPVPFQLAPGIILREVVDPPTATELHQAMQAWHSAGYVGHYCNVSHEIAVDHAVHHEGSEAFWMGRYALYALQIRTLRNFFAPVCANLSWSMISAIKDRSIDANVIESLGSIWTYAPQRDVVLEDMEWVAAHYQSFVWLWFNTKNVFRGAVEAFVDHPLQTSARMSTATLWSGIEALIPTGFGELRFRLAVYIASYLEPYGSQRHNLYSKVNKDYDMRSKAVHGSTVGPTDFITHSEAAAILLSRLLIRIIEDKRMPSKNDLEKALLGS